MKRRIISGVLSVIILAMVFQGCIPSLHTSGGGTGETSLDGAIPVIHEDQGPSQGGTLNLFMLQPETLNPLTTKNSTVRQMSGFVFDALFYETSEGHVENRLAQSYSFSQDGLILDISLRDNVFFHDGQALTADDAAFTVEAIQKAGSRSLYSENIANIQSVKAVNRLNLRIVLKMVDSRLIEKLVFPIVPQHVFEDWPIEGHSDALKLIGSGAFKFEAFKEDIVSLVRFDDWWYTKIADGLQHPVWMNGINFRVYPNESDMMQAFQRQDIDIAWLEDEESEIYAQRSDIFYNKFEGNTMEFLMLSHIGRTNSPIADEAFRTILLKYLSGYLSSNPMNIGNPVWDAIPGYDEDVINRIEIIEELENAGYTYKIDENLLIYHHNGAKLPVELTVKYNNMNTNRQKVSEKIIAALFEIGIKVTSESTTYSELRAAAESGKYDMMLLGCKLPLVADMNETLQLLKQSLGAEGQNSVVLPLYRNYGAVLYHNRIKGLRNPYWKDLYRGWQNWYLVGAKP